MKKRLRFALLALQDLEEIHDYIAADSPTAARRWIDRLERDCGRVALNPGIGKRREGLLPGLRSFTAGSYLIFYREQAEDVVIVRVLHGARDIDTLLS